MPLLVTAYNRNLRKVNNYNQKLLSFLHFPTIFSKNSCLLLLYKTKAHIICRTKGLVR